MNFSGPLRIILRLSHRKQHFKRVYLCICYPNIIGRELLTRSNYWVRQTLLRMEVLNPNLRPWENWSQEVLFLIHVCHQIINKGGSTKLSKLPSLKNVEHNYDRAVTKDDSSLRAFNQMRTCTNILADVSHKLQLCTYSLVTNMRTSANVCGPADSHSRSEPRQDDQEMLV